MNALYEATGGDEHAFPSAYELADSVGIPRADLSALVNYLAGENLLEGHWDFDGPSSVQIRHRGVVEVEEGLARPDQPTEHFAAISSIHFHGNVTNSQAALAGRDVAQTASYDGGQNDAIVAWLQQYTAALPELDESCVRLPNSS
jgi:hypothetical protein